MLTNCCENLLIVEIDPNFNLSNFIKFNSNDKLNKRNLSQYSMWDLDPNEIFTVIKENKEKVLEKSCLEETITKKIKKSCVEDKPNTKTLEYKYHSIETSQSNFNFTSKEYSEFDEFKDISPEVLKKLDKYYFKYEDWSKDFIKKISKKLNISLYKIYKWKIYKDL